MSENATMAAGRKLLKRHLVVCVDDDLGVLSAMKRLLRSEPYDVLTTSDPEVALEWSRDLDVGLLVTDERMPGMAGSDLLDRVVRQSPRTAGIIVTGYTTEVLSIPWVRDRVKLVFSKPWDGDELRWAIRELLHERENTPWKGP